MKKKKKIDFVMIILIIILLILLFFLAELKIFGKRYINFCGYTVFQVVTGSMEPAIRINDIVIVKLTDDVNQNDIITYKLENNFITHRVVKKTDEEIITKGDANNTEDNPITQDMIVGKVVYIISNVAVWIKVFKEPKVIVALLISIILIKLMFFNNMSNKKNNINNKNSEEE